MTNDRNQKIAKAIIAMKLITKTATGFTVKTPSMRGFERTYTIQNGKCTCLGFEENKTCEHLAAAEILAAEEKQAKVEAAKAKVEEILNSIHVSGVEVGFEESFLNVRIYSAITKDTGIPHLYRVRVEDSFETGEWVTTAKCNCPAGAKRMACRHVAAVAKVDAQNSNREIYPFELANYRAYKQAA